MTHYDPKVYDPSKLTGDDALVMKGFELCRGAVLKLFGDIAEFGSPVECCVSLFDELYSQVGADIGLFMKDRLDMERTELTVSLMEADPERYAGE